MPIGVGLVALGSVRMSTKLTVVLTARAFGLTLVTLAFILALALAVRFTASSAMMSRAGGWRLALMRRFPPLIQSFMVGSVPTKLGDGLELLCDVIDKLEHGFDFGSRIDFQGEELVVDEGSDAANLWSAASNRTGGVFCLEVIDELHEATADVLANLNMPQWGDMGPHGAKL